MGQYFRAVNRSKREFVCPWCLGWEGTLKEWAGHGAIFALLLRRSDQSGVGDFPGQTWTDDPHSSVGRWAGDSVFLVGDHDGSGLWEGADQSCRNISRQVARDWNALVKRADRKLTYRSCGEHGGEHTRGKEVTSV